VAVVEGQLLAAGAVCWPQLLHVEEVIENNNNNNSNSKNTHTRCT